MFSVLRKIHFLISNNLQLSSSTGNDCRFSNYRNERRASSNHSNTRKKNLLVKIAANRGAEQRSQILYRAWPSFALVKCTKQDLTPVFVCATRECVNE